MYIWFLYTSFHPILTGYINYIYNQYVLLTFTKRLTRFYSTISTAIGREERTEIKCRQLVAPDVYHRLQRYQLFGILFWYTG